MDAQMLPSLRRFHYLGAIIALVTFFLGGGSFFRAATLRHMEVPRLVAESELSLQADTTAMAMPDLIRVCDLHHSSQRCWIL